MSRPGQWIPGLSLGLTLGRDSRLWSCDESKNLKRFLNLRLKLDWNCFETGFDSGSKESKLNEVRWVMSSMTHYHESLSWSTRWKAMLRNICYVIGIVHECPSRGYYWTVIFPWNDNKFGIRSRISESKSGLSFRISHIYESYNNVQNQSVLEEMRFSRRIRSNRINRIRCFQFRFNFTL